MDSVERQASGELVKEANQDRARYGLPPLRQDADLVKAAWLHAQRMVPTGRLSHDLPGEPSLTARVQAAGVRCTTVAENLAKAPTANMINDNWMHSPPHRRNLLDPRLNSVGIAVVKVGGELYAVQDFAREVKSLSGSQQEEQVSSLLRKRGLRILPDSAPARSYCNGTPRGARSSPRLVIKYSTSDLSQLPQQVKHGIGAGKYRSADVGVCSASIQNGFRAYRIVILLY
ncbi:MAG TPA: CAP domain-containing protein [Acidobacteriaceae bacterium]|nr:CAP domain-containing protein [Acidobacteriaceae bacterium]